MKNLALEKRFTSHIDIIPTILGLVGISKEKIIQTIQKSGKFKEIRHLSGDNILNPDTKKRNLAYFYTRDNVFHTENFTLFHSSGYRIAIMMFGKFIADELAKIVNFKFDAPWAHQSIEVVVFYHDMKKIKFVRYFDDPSLWKNPFLNHSQKIQGNRNSVLRKFDFGNHGDILHRNHPFQDFYEVFDLETDVNELRNLCDQSEDCKRLKIFKIGLDMLKLARKRHLFDAKSEFPGIGDDFVIKQPIVLSLTNEMMPPGYLKMKILVYLLLISLTSFYVFVCKWLIDRINVFNI